MALDVPPEEGDAEPRASLGRFLARHLPPGEPRRRDATPGSLGERRNPTRREASARELGP